MVGYAGLGGEVAPGAEVRTETSVDSHLSGEQRDRAGQSVARYLCE